jgi:hypothetical protein
LKTSFSIPTLLPVKFLFAKAGRDAGEELIAA